ncbi:LysR substrate-binding domain-containing protein [Comamonas endophytica]|uniref:LysR substrate-binding domain-containing protein n=1 Tax=Comamonas endophytica TaxID=2949090 RepID=A0ABY6GHA6_9BURK|nr:MULTISPECIES: LysR substrate-binding domain-containing protein [unclassified Acidovorax]MCD2513348.1 LysR substrate-binding domain-containing protein [Acidovorax sp. D4N7]UYG53867.1 LysR substrate-binding domain-containing protein [Acidovorax sp. 5MLIR]
MKLHFLRYFVVLAEELHFGRAASKLAITQPPLSSAIKSLEEELEVQLLIRDSKHVELTQAGEAFLEEARQILEQVARASSVAKIVARGMRGRLEIGMTGSQVYREVPEIVRQFNAQMPDVDVVLNEMSSADQINQLLRGQIHAGFVNASTVPPQLACLPMHEDEFVICLPQGHPRARSSSVELKQLEHERFVMFSRDVAPANYDNVIAIFSRAGIHPQIAHAARQWLTIIAMVANGLGVSVVPSTLARSRVHGVRFVKIKGEQVLAPAMLVWNPAYCPPTLRSFIGCSQGVLAAGQA